MALQIGSVCADKGRLVVWYRVMSSPLTPEQKTRKEVLKYLRDKGHAVFPIDTRSRVTSRGTYATFNPDYGTKGCADLLCFHKTSTISPVWVELKRKGKRKIDSDQVIFREYVQLLGHEYIVVQGKEDLVAQGF